MKFNLLAGACIVAMMGSGPAIAENRAENRIDQIRPDAPELAAYGTAPVGVRTLNLTNPNQINVAKAEAGKEPPRYDRPLTLEVWYPAKTDQMGGEYRTLLRDGKTEVTLKGRAVRDVEPLKPERKYPLIIISHGYPGNRMLLSPLAENLASKGYVVASIDHTDSTYADRGPFGSTLVNRPLDQKFVLDEISRQETSSNSFLSGLVDTSTTGLIGYSMGAYGAVITAGAGVSDSAVTANWSAPNSLLAIHKAGSETHRQLFDQRFKAILAIAPWGMQRGMWDAAGLAEIKVPLFIMAGSVDDVSDYQKGIRKIFEAKMPVDRYLLTFDNANHNAAAPMPAPAESWKVSETLGYAPFDHYADPVWDTVRMNNIAQHFASVWFDLKLKGDQDKARYLDLVEDAEKGVWSAQQGGGFKPDHTYWAGFKNRTAKGLKLEHRKPD
ncbi:alpha/beta hydrolase family protein [Rhizobium rhizoryzae]|uniref:alpha/beta hydrolase family protein n=1 Tax=Rhizobium rhizoryzae TaxID=451876 RepID=UPI0028A01A37|nr:dienelactone hydrolase [Rhizobium rhizoryzae]